MAYRKLLVAAALTALPLAVLAQEAPRPSEPGSPVAITKIVPYTERQTRGGVTISTTELTCISFQNVSSKTLTSVTFEMSKRRANGTATEVKLHKRDGTFSPGVEIRGFQGERVGYADAHAMSNCPVFAPAIPGAGDAVLTVIRPIAATFEDGTTWTSAGPPVVATTPVPKPTAVVESDAPPWDAGHHTGYVAVLTDSRTAPQQVLIFAPGRRGPSATLTFEHCCTQAVAFDRTGNLIVGTMSRHTGVLVYAPGAHEPTKTLADHDGFSIAYDDAGDVAIGGYNSGPDVGVFPANAAVYRVPGQPVVHGLAMAPNGELAMIDYKSRMVRTYAPGTTTPAREIAFDSVPATPNGVPPLGSVAYDRDGRLAVFELLRQTVRVYNRGSVAPAFTIPVRASAIAFDGAGRLYAVTPSATLRFGRDGGAPATVLTHGGVALAVDASGARLAIMSSAREEVVVAEDGGSQTVIPVGAIPRAIAISP